MFEMASSEELCLTWAEFQDNLKSSFTNLREETSFTDATLVSEDGEQFEAHQVILTISSPLLSNILKMNRPPNPVIYLTGFKAKELEALLNFMYNGVAAIYYSNLDDFLAKAEELKINGLTEGSGIEAEQGKTNFNNELEQFSKGEEPQIQGFKGEPGAKSEAESMYLIKELEQFADKERTMDQIHKSTVMTTSNSSTHVLMIGDSPEDAYECTRCDKTFRSKNSRMKHTYIKV